MQASRLLQRPDLVDACLEARRVSWACDPYSRGGYAHIPAGDPARGEEATGWDDPRVGLAEPVWEGCVLWAGEATAYDRCTIVTR